MSRLFLGAAALALLVSFATESSARERTKSGTTAKGGSYSSTLKAGDGTRTRTSAGTNAAGKTWSKSATTSVDKDSKSYTRSVTGANGVTRDITGAYGDGQTSGSYTTSNGKTGTYAHPTGQRHKRRTAGDGGQ